jgi:hypothetical protein
LSLAALLACAGIGTAQAIPVVDTGTPTMTNFADPAYSFYAQTDFDPSHQFLASRFTITEAYAITGMSAFVRDFACCGFLPNQFSLAIATGPDTLADTALSHLFEVQTSFDSSNGASGWAGAAVDNYLLSAGTYWVVAFVAPGQVNPAMGMPGGAPNPLEVWAWNSGGTTGWRSASTAGNAQSGLGFRIEGELVPVPEPGTFALMLAGFLGVLTLVRRRRV